MKRALAALAAFTLFALPVVHAEAWLDNYDAAVAQAKKENKLVLVDFTGSDWCGWCIKMKKDVFSKPEFNSFAKDKLVLLELDYPQAKKLSPSVVKQNEVLQQKFKVEGFPTLVLLDGSGKELARNSGYLPGGPDALIAWVNNAKK